jgi:hypothetical protein
MPTKNIKTMKDWKEYEKLTRHPDKDVEGEGEPELYCQPEKYGE